MIKINQLLLKKTEDIEIFLDPFNMKIMRIIKDEHCPMTVKEIGDRMGEAPSKIYYHVKKLESIGVLYIKNTKQINGIVAKYYDFTADRVGLSVPEDNEQKDTLYSQLMREYGQSFDNAKQKFYDLFNYKDESNLDIGDSFILEENSFLIDPDKIRNLNDDIQALIQKYRSNQANAVNYSIFISAIRNFGKEY